MQLQADWLWSVLVCEFAFSVHPGNLQCGDCLVIGLRWSQVHIRMSSCGPTPVHCLGTALVASAMVRKVVTRSTIAIWLRMLLIRERVQFEITNNSWLKVHAVILNSNSVLSSSQIRSRKYSFISLITVLIYNPAFDIWVELYVEMEPLILNTWLFY
jgi:hypothetical protein